MKDIRTKQYRLMVCGFHPPYDDRPPFLGREEKDGFYEWWGGKEHISSKILAIAWAVAEIGQLEGVLVAHLFRIDICRIVEDMQVYEEEHEIEVWHEYYPKTEERLKIFFPPMTF